MMYDVWSGAPFSNLTTQLLSRELVRWNNRLAESSGVWNQSPWKPEKMVVAALLRDCIFNPIGMQCQLSQQFLGKPGKKESQRRSREWSVWTASISNDLDLAADWWFLSSLLQQREQQGGLWSLRNLDPTLFALYVFTIAGTVTWALQVFKTVCIDTNSKQQIQRRCWDFVPLLVLICEDIPQIALTWIISSSFLGTYVIVMTLYVSNFVK